MLRIFVFLLIGLMAGWLAGKIMKGKGFGLAGNLLLGVVGAFIGGYILQFVGFSHHGILSSLTTAVIGSMLLLYVVGAMKK